MIEQQVGKFKRRITFKPGFNFIREKPSSDYGIGGVRIWFILVGELGAVQWQIGTEWFPESARKHLKKFPFNERDIEKSRRPEGWDLGYHARKPMYDDQKPMHCDIFPEGECYYDGSSLSADYLIEGFLNGGDEWVWNRLEAYYAHTFEDKDWPNFDPIIEPHPDDRKPAS